MTSTINNTERYDNFDESFLPLASDIVNSSPMLVWKAWVTYIECMIVVERIEVHEAYFVYACAISRVRERVILEQGRGDRIDCNSSVCNFS